MNWRGVVMICLTGGALGACGVGESAGTAAAVGRMQAEKAKAAAADQKEAEKTGAMLNSAAEERARRMAEEEKR